MKLQFECENLGQYDVIVVGAGPAGLCAAKSAARYGSRVALIERDGCVGGNLTSGCVGPILGNLCPGSIAEEINRLLLAGEEGFHDVEEAIIRLTEWIADDRIDIYYHCAIFDVLKSANQVIGVAITSQNGPAAIYGKTVVDATGDGAVSAMAGASWEYGQEGSQSVQPASIMFVIDGVNPDQPLVCCHECDDTVLSNGSYLELCRNACKSGELPENVDVVRLYRSSAYPTERMVNATQLNGVNGLQFTDIDRAQKELRRQIHAVVRFLQTRVEGFENCRVKRSSNAPGFRETRRIVGEYTVTKEDLLQGRKFEDTVVHNAQFCLDMHNPNGGGQADEELSFNSIPKPYDLPYRTFLPKGIDGLLVCGRCISGTHWAHSSYRVMNTCMAMGQAVGLAAAMSAQSGIQPKKLDVKQLQLQLQNVGVRLFD